MEEVVSDLVKVQGIEIGFQELKIENYSMKKGMDIDKFIDSESFTVGGHHWKIFFYPGGINAKANEVGKTSLYLYHIGERSDVSSSSCSVWSLYEGYVVDQTGQGNHWGASFFAVLPPKGIPYFKPSYLSGYPQFINNKELTSYLKDDSLIIRVAVGVLTFKRQPYVAVSNSFIGADFGKLLETRHCADVMFEIGSETFHAHRCILAARSSFFESTFSGDYQNKQETISLDTDPGLFKAMLWFIYTDDLREEKQEKYDKHVFIPESFLGKMARTADEFGVSSLKKVCESRILEMICVQGVSPLLQSAIDRGDYELKEACLKFIDHQAKGGGYNSLQVNCQQLLSTLSKEKTRQGIHTWKDALTEIFKDYVTALYSPISIKQKRN